MFQFYNKWLSLVGAIICSLIMVSIDVKMSACVGCALIILYKIASRKRHGKLILKFKSNTKIIITN